MDKIILVVEAEKYHDEIKALPVPVIAYGVYFEDNPDVILVYKELEEAA